MLRILIVLFALGSTLSAYAEEVCVPGQYSTLVQDDSKSPWISTDTRARTLLVEMVRLARIKQPLLCEYEARMTPIVHVLRASMFTNGQHVILLPQQALREFNDRALRGAMAHEVGHLKRGMPKDSSYAGIEREEREVDLLAARWVGKRDVVEALQAAARLIEKYSQDEESRKANRSRLDERVRDLERSPR